MRKIGFRAALKLLGAENISIHANGGPACTDWSGFFDGTGIIPQGLQHPVFEKGQCYYVIFSNDHIAGLPLIMHRKCKDRKDYHGEQNQWSLEGTLKSMGYALKPMTDTRKPRW